MSNVPLPRPGPLGLIQYAGVDMLQYAGEMSAAKDAEIAQLRAELIKSLADNAALRADAIDDGDALRLAATCHMVLDWSGSELHVRFWLTQSPEAPTLTFKSSDCGGDKATIVRAAAEIGRAMS